MVAVGPGGDETSATRHLHGDGVGRRTDGAQRRVDLVQQPSCQPTQQRLVLRRDHLSLRRLKLTERDGQFSRALLDLRFGDDSPSMRIVRDKSDNCRCHDQRQGVIGVGGHGIELHERPKAAQWQLRRFSHKGKPYTTALATGPPIGLASERLTRR